MNVRVCWPRFMLFAMLLAASPTVLEAADSKRTIAAASSLRHVWPALMADFGEELPVAFGASGNLTRQILQGAPFAVLLAADSISTQRVVDKQLSAAPPAHYARGHLVVVSTNLALPATIDAGQLLHFIEKHDVERLALANPRHAPYGKAAEHFLMAFAENTDKVQTVFGENASQALQFVLAAAADIGLVPESLVHAPGIKERVSIARIADGQYPEVLHEMVLLKSADAGASRFYTYMQSSAAASILQRFGFTPP